MIRLYSLTLCAALIGQPVYHTVAFAYEGPQEQALDKSLNAMQTQDAPAAPAPMAPAPMPAEPAHAAPAPAPKATSPAPHKKHTKPKKATATQSTTDTETGKEGANELRMDQGLQPEGGSDPAGDAVVQKLNGGQ